MLQDRAYSRVGVAATEEHARANRYLFKDKQKCMLFGRRIMEWKGEKNRGLHNGVFYYQFLEESFGPHWNIDVGNYWARKAGDRNFHPLSHGGHRAFVLTEGQSLLWQVCLLVCVTETPRATLYEMRMTILEATGIAVLLSTISTTLKKWNLAKLKVIRMQEQKFTDINVQRYIAYIRWIADINGDFLKFVDEAHFDGKQLIRSYAWGKRGSQVTVVNAHDINERLTMTAFLTLDPAWDHPVEIRYRFDGNNADTFLDDVRDLANQAPINGGRTFFSDGDIFVMDNASVHSQQEHFEAMRDMLQERHGTAVKFLPPYSPEFNPCELFWAYLKNTMRQTRKSDESLLTAIIRITATVTRGHVLGWYRACIQDQLQGQPTFVA
jgi:hypothetical protein